MLINKDWYPAKDEPLEQLKNIMRTLKI